MRVEDGLNYVFSDRRYFYLTLVLSAVFIFLFSYSFGLIYLTPSFYLNISQFLEDGMFNIFLNFIFITVAPVLAAMTVSISIFNYFEIKKTVSSGTKLGGVGLFSAMFTSVCSECVPVFIYSVGVTYGLFSAFLSPFVIPIKIASILVLTASFYLSARSVGLYCSIKRR